ncbi:MAG: radical SAM protein [Candidatus Cloacimonetes bacterium]|nr:radical SAM protein [Candidatus Cloacimonadota bacterium]
MKTIEIECKTFINRMNDGYFAMRYLPFRFTGNIYRGCTHGCVYCYAACTHHYMKASPNDFSKIVFVKINSPEIFEKELRKYNDVKKKKSVIIIGNISDVYQPIEIKYRLTRKMLKLCLEYHFPCFIETKSSLILEDLDIIEELADKDLIGIGMTVTSYDNEFTKLVEPFIPKLKYIHCEIIQKERILTLKKLSSIGVDTYLHITPYFPEITDRDIEKIISDASDANVGNVIMAPLELSSYIWDCFSKSLMKNDRFANLSPIYEELYFEKGRKLGGRISTSDSEHYSLEKKVSSLCKKYDIGYWAFTNPQFNTAKISGAYKLRYPILIDYWNLAKEMKEITYKDAVELANNFPIDNRYLKTLREYWIKGKLFEGIYGIKKIDTGDEPYYIYNEKNQMSDNVLKHNSLLNLQRREKK